MPPWARSHSGGREQAGATGLPPGSAQLAPLPTAGSPFSQGQASQDLAQHLVGQRGDGGGRVDRTRGAVFACLG